MQWSFFSCNSSKAVLNNCASVIDCSCKSTERPTMFCDNTWKRLTISVQISSSSLFFSKQQMSSWRCLSSTKSSFCYSTKSKLFSKAVRKATLFSFSSVSAHWWRLLEFYDIFRDGFCSVHSEYLQVFLLYCLISFFVVSFCWFNWNISCTFCYSWSQKHFLAIVDP